MTSGQLDLPLAKDITLDAMRCDLQGTSLIEASAGTGKTYAITTLYLRLLLERGLSVPEILVVTYTRAATAELRDRIRKRLRQAQGALEAGCDDKDPEMDTLAKQRVAMGTQAEDHKRVTLALRSFDQASIFTIHGFCQRVLQDSAFESGADFDTAFLSDQNELVAEIVNDFWALEMYGAEAQVVRLLTGSKPSLSPEELAKLARKVTQNPSMPVLPSLDADAGKDAIATWSELRERAATLWAAERDVIVASLDGNDSLKKNMYKAGQASGPWASGMDQCLAVGQLGVPKDFKGFEKFTTSGIRKGTKKGGTVPEHPFYEICEALQVCSAALTQVSMSVNLALVEYARTELAARKQALSLQSYDDLLFRLAAALESKGGPRLAKLVAERFPGALIDEFQDTDPLQYRIFETVYGDPKSSTSLFLIGDPKQAIYAFRGADVFAYMEARKNAGDGRQTMGTNWRSDPALVEAVNTVFSHSPSSFVFDAIEFEKVTHSPKARNCLDGVEDSAALQIVYLDSEGHKGAIAKGWADLHVPEMTARSIASFLASGATIRKESKTDSSEHLESVRPGDIAVLVRKNRQATAIQEALRLLKVPSVVESDASVFECEEAVELERVLVGIANPRKGRFLLSALTTSILGLSGDEASLLRSQEEAWETWLTKFREWNKIWEDYGFIQAFRMLLGEQEVPERLLAKTGGERRLTNLYHLGELLQAEASDSKLGAQGLVRWMHRMRTDAAARSEEVGDSSKMRLESDADAVKLVTIHKSKGLEYPIVYCPFLWDGALLSKHDLKAVRFHDPEAGDELKLDIGSPEIGEHLKIAKREALAENLRLLYVALTRAKHRCTLLWGGFSGSEHSPLAFLWHRGESADTSVAGLAAAAAHAKQLDDQGRLQDLQELCQASNGTISVQPYLPQEAEPYVGEQVTTKVLQARGATRSVRALGRFSSFSALVSGGRSEGEERDIDREHATTTSLEVPEAREEEESRAVALSEFPRGARIGVMMHEVFEHTDFDDSEGTSLAQAAQDAFRRYGVGEDPSERFLPAMQACLETPLSSARVPSSPRLCALSRDARLDEMEFLFPVARQGAALTAEAIAKVLRSHADAPWPAGYPADVAKIDFVPLQGFMRGFVDLIFCHEERWYLADYKSNFLGPEVRDYAAAALPLSMASHHYFLQYLVYTVALHRYLQSRLPDYRYETHMGGVFYLFVRGMSPEHPEGSGVFGDLPPKELVLALSALFGGDESAGTGAKPS